MRKRKAKTARGSAPVMGAVTICRVGHEKVTRYVAAGGKRNRGYKKEGMVGNNLWL